MRARSLRDIRAEENAHKARLFRRRGLRLREIAAHMGVTEWTVCSWLRWSGAGPIHQNRKKASTR